MDTFKITQEQLQLVEKTGIIFEKSGLQPAPARVHALLLIADKTELTFDEIRETLQISKGATSNALNVLLNIKRIEYITRTGDRKRYFRSHINKWKEGINDSFSDMRTVHDAMREILSQRTAETPEFNRNLGDAIDLMEFIFAEIPAIFARWEKSRNQNN